MGLRYKVALISLLPPGKIWEDTWIDQLFDGVGKVFQRIDDRARRVFIDELPDMLGIYLHEWARVLDIQKPNSVKVRGKLGSVASQATASYQELLDRISSEEVQIEYLRPSTVGMNCGGYLASYDWRFAALVSGVNQEELETISETIESMKQAHLSFLFFNRRM